MSIASEITALNTNLSAAKNAVTAKGGTVSNTGLAGLASEIAGIPSGGGDGGTTHSEPAKPTNCYAVVKAYNFMFYVTEIIQNPNSGVTVSFREPSFLDFTTLISQQAVFQEDQNTGTLWNLGFRYDSNNSMYEFYCVDSSSNEQVLESMSEWDLEGYGIQISNQVYSDTELAYITIMPRLDLAPSAEYTITNPAAFSELMAPLGGSYEETNVDEPLSGFIDIDGQGSYINKYFISDINFGDGADSVTSIGDDFMANAYLLVGVHNLPSGLTTIGNYFLQDTSIASYLKLPSTVTTIGAGFLSECQFFDQPLDISHVTTIGGNFLTGCSMFNQPLTLNNAVSIASGFLGGCTSFNQDLTIPANATLGTASSYQFLYNCNSMVSKVIVKAPATVIGTSNYILSTQSNQAPAYTTGIMLSGDAQTVQAWRNKLADRTTNPYRKIIVDMDVPANTLVTNAGVVLPLTAADLDNLGSSLSGWSITLNGVTVTSSEIYGVDISGLNVTTLRTSFLGNSSVQKLVLSNTITTINSNFLVYCRSFNSDLVLPSSITSIGSPDYASFMIGCNNMTKTVYCNCPAPTPDNPSGDGTLSVTSSTASAYTKGIKLAGTYASDWKTTFPDRSDGNPFYRKLILAS